jgi:hypothetical protein
MSDRLEAILAALRRKRRRRATGPALRGRRAVSVTPGEVIARHDVREDPLTGHRGVAEGFHLLVRAGDWLVDLQLRDEKTGVVLRGQVLPAGGEEEAAAPSGALVHARSAGQAHLACVDGTGEFVLRGLPASTIEGLQLELEDGVHELPWPGESCR